MTEDSWQAEVGDRVRVKPNSSIAELLPALSGVVIETVVVLAVAYINVDLDGGGVAMQTPANEWEEVKGDEQD